jgi:hypothetical protein
VPGQDEIQRNIIGDRGSACRDVAFDTNVALKDLKVGTRNVRRASLSSPV